jgi:hypothetical protein
VPRRLGQIGIIRTLGGRYAFFRTGGRGTFALFVRVF